MARKVGSNDLISCFIETFNAIIFGNFVEGRGDSIEDGLLGVGDTWTLN